VAIKAEVEALAPGVMSLGAPHPSIAGLYVDSWDATPKGQALDGSGAIFEIDVTYAALSLPPIQEPPEEPGEDADPTFGLANITQASGARQITTTKDWQGNDVELEYRTPAVPGSPSVSRFQYPAIPKLVIVPETRVVRRERITRRQLAAKQRKYTGCTNDGPWTLDTTAKPGTWLVADIRGSSDDGGKTYTVTYSFVFDDGGHDVEVWYKAENGTRQKGGDVKQVQVYRRVALNDLNIPEN